MTEYGNQIRSHSREWKTDDFFCLFFFGFVSLLLFILCGGSGHSEVVGLNDVFS